MSRKIILCLALMMLAVFKSLGQIPSIIEKDGRHALLVDGKPFLILGGQAHNSSGWPAMMPQLWKAAEAMHLNTIEIPIYWEQIEAQQGKFDFSPIDTLLAQSRQHNVHLVLLWFATWKNGSNHYMPSWMKSDAAKYPNIVGDKGQAIDSPSPHSKATLDADIKAFTAVMKYLKKADGQHTVIMVQVENESGSWGSVRDYSATGNKLFAGNVPAELLKPEILKELNVPVVSGGTWKTVFGDRADEYFQAWSVSKYIGQVAAAAKAEYSLPLYVNCALRDPLTNPTANNYESGGPTDNVIPIWKAAAPAIDVLAPDIYLQGTPKVLKVIELYNRKDNALFVPEAGSGSGNSKYVYTTIANGGIGFSPFGIDDNGHGATDEEMSKRISPFGQEYALIGSMMRELAQWAFDGKATAVIEKEDHADQTIDLGSWQGIVSFGGGRGRTAAAGNPQTNGKMMIVKMDENNFVVFGTLSHITFKGAGKNADKAWQYLKVEEGYYENGKFKMLRILNGDETDWGGPRFGATPTVLQISLVAR